MPESIYKSAKNSIAEYLKERRIDMQLSIQQLSKETGISTSHISRIERGVRNPSPKTLELIAPSLAIEYTTLLRIAGLIGDPKSRCVDLGLVLTDKICIFRDREIAPKQKQQIMSILESQE